MRNNTHSNKHPAGPVVPTSATAKGSSSSMQPTRRGRKLFVSVARVLLILFFCVGLISSLSSWGRAFARTTMLLPSLLTASEPLPLKASGEPVRHSQMTVPSRNGTVYLDIYAPTTPAPLIPHVRNGVLILPGVGDQRRDPQLINLSEALAHSGMIVANMTTTTLLNDDVAAQDSDGVVQAFETLARLPGMAGQRIGMMSFSAGVPLACFAAADPRIRNRVAYIAAFGGYFNTASALRAVGRRTVSFDGKTERWQPVAYSLQVLTNVITRTFAPDEQYRLREAFAPGGSPLSPAEVARLSPGARAAYSLLSGSEPDNVDANLAALPPDVHAILAQLSPSRVIAEIRAPIFLLHDRYDAFLPFTESRDFAAALVRLHHEHDYVEFSIFTHVEVKSNLYLGQILGDGSRLFSIMNRVLLIGSE